MTKLLVILSLIHSFIISFFFHLHVDRRFTYTIEADYVLSYKPDSTKNEIREEYMELLINKQESVFRSKKKGVIDSIRKSSKKSDVQTLSLLQANITPINYYIYKFGGDLVTQDEYQLKPNAMFYKEPNKFDWVIANDTLAISGIKCQKATTNFGGRYWIAWFAQEIPLNDGPYKFSGLPGLIVRAYDINKNWYFDLASLTEKTNSILVDFDQNADIKFMQKKAFFKAKKTYLRNRTKVEEASGFIMSMDAQTRARSYAADKKKAERDNNWIELFEAVIK